MRLKEWVVGVVESGGRSATRRHFSNQDLLKTFSGFLTTAVEPKVDGNFRLLIWNRAFNWITYRYTKRTVTRS